MRGAVVIAAMVGLIASTTGCGAGGNARTSPTAASVPPGQAAAPSPPRSAAPPRHPEHGRAPSPARSADPARQPNHRPVVVRVARTPYGQALTDGRGFALYRFTHDRSASSTCYAACAAAWPPYLVSTRPTATGPGADAHLLGVARRADGRLQVTYAGHPLYYYVGDRHPRQVLCQAVSEFGGTWYVVARNGSAIT